MSLMTREEALQRVSELEEQVRQLKTMELPAWTNYEKLPFSGQERKLLSLLLRSGEAANENIVTLFWGDDPHGGPDNPGNVVKVVVAKMRRKLAGIGVKIFTIYGHGYVMSKTDRDRVLNANPDVDFKAVIEAEKTRRAKYEIFCTTEKTRPARRRTGKWSWK